LVIVALPLGFGCCPLEANTLLHLEEHKIGPVAAIKTRHGRAVDKNWALEKNPGLRKNLVLAPLRRLE
jgi:hypothetical protein